MIYDLNSDEIYTYLDKYLDKYLNVRVIEKNKYGEVFTPPALIEKMLDLLPSFVFKNPELKWLDPTAGTGNFMAVVYLRLMHGLEKWEPNKQKRSNHIIENMLYMVELNKRNVNISKKLFGKKANILQGDFLLDNPIFSMHFDIIVGNPPFQDDIEKGKGLDGKKERRVGSKNKLYERILEKCLHLLNSGGFLTFITPDNLFSGSSHIYLEMIKDNHVRVVSFDKSIQSYFPQIQQYMCYFLLQKGSQDTDTNTLIIGNDGTRFYCKLIERPVNPVRDWTPYSEKLINKYISFEKNDVVYHRGSSVDMYNKNSGKYAIIYKPDTKLYTNNLSLAVGYGEKKIVLFLISPDLKFETDFEGAYGVGPNTFYIPFTTKREGLLLEKFLRSDIYKTLALSTKTNRQFLKIKFVEHLNFKKILELDSSTKRKSRNSKNSRKNKNNKKIGNKTRKNK
jgi:hypothetical protein